MKSTQPYKSFPVLNKQKQGLEPLTCSRGEAVTEKTLRLPTRLTPSYNDSCLTKCSKCGQHQYASKRKTVVECVLCGRQFARQREKRGRHNFGETWKLLIGALRDLQPKVKPNTTEVKPIGECDNV